VLASSGYEKYSERVATQQRAMNIASDDREPQRHRADRFEYRVDLGKKACRMSRYA